jgi:Transposase, Mutator family
MGGGGTLYIATVKTGTREIIVIAFAIISGNEDGKGWRYFCKHLERSCSVLTLPHPLERVAYNLFTFVSDRDKGLMEALRLYFNDNHATHCSIHLQRNVETKFDKVAARNIHSISSSFSMREVQQYFTELENHSKQAKEYVDSFEPSTWCSTVWLNDKSLPPRYGIVTTNISESMNNMLSDARECSWIETIDYIMVKIISRASSLRAIYRKEKGLIEEWSTILNKRWEQCAGFKVHEVNEEGVQYLIERPTIGTNMTTRHHTINITDKTCSCGLWQEHDVPCIDACAYYRLREHKTIDSVKEISSDYYKYEYVYAVFKNTFTPVIIDNLEKDGDTKPPCVQKKRKAGRPKFQRLRSRHKGNKKIHIICSKCKKEGHNKRTCDARVARDKQKEKGSKQELDLS